MRRQAQAILRSPEGGDATACELKGDFIRETKKGSHVFSPSKLVDLTLHVCSPSKLVYLTLPFFQASKQTSDAGEAGMWEYVSGSI